MARERRRGFWARLAEGEGGAAEDRRRPWEKLQDARDLIAQVRLDLAEAMLFRRPSGIEALRGLERRIDPVIAALDELQREPAAREGPGEGRAIARLP